MAEYEVEITKRLMKTVTISVPDDVPVEEVKDWVGEFADEVFDVDPYQGVVEWDVDDLIDGREIKMTARTNFEDHEYEIEGFKATDNS